MKLETKAPVQSRFATPASASPSGGRLDDLPAPRTSRGGHKLGCLALLALLLVAGAALTAVGLGLAFSRLRCPHCGESLMLGGRLPTRLPKHCPGCGKEL